MNRLPALAMVTSLACGEDAPQLEDDDDTIVFDGGPDAPLSAALAHAYVVEQVTVPTDDDSLEALAQDIDGDGESENQLGAVFATYADLGGTPQAVVDAALTDGTLRALLDLRANNLANDSAAELSVFGGIDLDDPADPTDDFDGDESFTATDGRGAMAAIIDSGTLVAGPGAALLRLPLIGTEALDIELVSVRIRATVDIGQLTAGLIGGGMPIELVESEIVPAVAAALNDFVSQNPKSPDTVEILELFDTNSDGEISVSEVEGNALVGALLAPDLDLCTGACGDGVIGPDGEDDSISLTLGFAAVSARIDSVLEE